MKPKTIKRNKDKEKCMLDEDKDNRKGAQTMILEQLSIFFEKKLGGLNEVMIILGDNNIKVSAFSMADTSDYQIAKIIVTDPFKAVKLLKEEGFSVQITPVICCKILNQPGKLEKILSYLACDGIIIKYMYGLSVGDDMCMILQTEDCDKTIACLQTHQIEIVTARQVYK